MCRWRYIVAIQMIFNVLGTKFITMDKFEICDPLKVPHISLILVLTNEHILVGYDSMTDNRWIMQSNRLINKNKLHDDVQLHHLSMNTLLRRDNRTQTLLQARETKVLGFLEILACCYTTLFEICWNIAKLVDIALVSLIPIINPPNSVVYKL